ncbi:heme exporter protein CcmD [Psychrobacter sp. FDAARGOS_221]|uniref:heme exporter protein CcmD n=1 Tax=Psychrobacter sp. FDAARGOS_221 TaxID=1975705 RepID=UPI000BB5749F|nr:heme exporter protein CcmD [Psychrobacter sp. FDAARGOS_221]PNK60983.1 heme exporter protein CcmD [Psychrobacter sp. FDAARGOS_221]
MQPYFYSIQEFLAMGEHGPYVWSTWGITVAAVIGFIFYSIHQRRRLLKDLKVQQARQQQRKQAAKR